MRFCFALFLTMLSAVSAAEIPLTDWPNYNRDLSGTRYSPLTQINPRNVAKLKEVWTFHLHQAGESPAVRASTEAVPIVANNVMYLPAGDSVVALEPESGKEIWRYKMPTGIPNRRGVAYWPGDKNNPPRIIFTAGHRLIGLNARTGKIDPGFGKEGEVDTVVAYQASPTVYKNLVLVGANVATENNGVGEPGDTRAFDARTGAKLWNFHSVPGPGEAGNDTWEGDGWKDRSGVHQWSLSFVLDTQRNLIYTTFASPAYDYWGGDRKGNNLFGNSVVALDADTGKMKWYHQLVHHDLWDFDLPPTPVLLDVTKARRSRSSLNPARSASCIFSTEKRASRFSASLKHPSHKARCPASKSRFHAADSRKAPAAGAYEFRHG